MLSFGDHLVTRDCAVMIMRVMHALCWRRGAGGFHHRLRCAHLLPRDYDFMGEQQVKNIAARQDDPENGDQLRRKRL